MNLISFSLFNLVKKLRYIRFLLFFSGDKEFTVKVNKKLYFGVNGQSFYHNYQEIFIKELYKFESYGNDEVNILDCGSNFGLATIYFLKKYPTSKVFGFEPDLKFIKD